MWCRLLLCSSWTLSSSDCWALWTGAQSLCSRSHSHDPLPSRCHHYCDCSTGGDVPGSSSADGLSTLPTTHHHPHQPRHRPHEYSYLYVLLLCRLWSRLLLDPLFDWRPQGCDAHLPELQGLYLHIQAHMLTVYSINNLAVTSFGWVSLFHVHFAPTDSSYFQPLLTSCNYWFSPF